MLLLEHFCCASESQFAARQGIAGRGVPFDETKFVARAFNLIEGFRRNPHSIVVDSNE